MAKYEFYKEIGAIIECTLERETELEIPAVLEDTEVKIIGIRAFADCVGVKHIIVPEGVTTIDEEAFEIRGLESIDIPSSIQKCFYDAIPYGVRVECKGEMTKKHYRFNSDTGVFRFNHNLEFVREIIIPSEINGVKVTRIQGTHADPEDSMHREYVRKLVIPDTVTHIGNYVFVGMGIEELTIPDSVKSIGRCAFLSCSNLKKVNLGQGVKKIHEEAFLHCFKLTDIICGDNVAKIARVLFGNCQGLKNIKSPNISYHYEEDEI